MEQESTVENQLAELKSKKGLAAPTGDDSKALGSGDSKSEASRSEASRSESSKS
jgi:hypothetical protein